MHTKETFFSVLDRENGKEAKRTRHNLNKISLHAFFLKGGILIRCYISTCISFLLFLNPPAKRTKDGRLSNSNKATFHLDGWGTIILIQLDSAKDSRYNGTFFDSIKVSKYLVPFNRHKHSAVLAVNLYVHSRQLSNLIGYTLSITTLVFENAPSIERCNMNRVTVQEPWCPLIWPQEKNAEREIVRFMVLCYQ